MHPALLLLAASFLTAPARAAAPMPFSPAVEERLDLLLADMLGPGRAHAFVRLVDRSPDGPDPVPPDPAPQPAALWDRISARLEQAPPVLPGFPAPRSLREEVVRELVRQGAAVDKREAAQQGLSVMLIVDQAVGDPELAAASEAVTRALDLAPRRGDTLQTARAPMAKTRRDPAVSAGAAAGGTVGLALLTGLVLVAMALRGRRTALVVSDSRSAPAFDVHRPIPPAPPQLPFLPTADPDLAPLTPEAAALAAELLRDGPAAVAAWLLGKATPAEAAQVYARLPGPIRQGAARLLVDAGEPYPEPVRFPADLKDKLERRVTGILRLEEIVLRLGEPFRTEATATLRFCSPKAAARLGALPFFLDLAAADPADLRLCLSAFSTDALAAALSPEAPELRRAFLDAVPAVAADLVRERLPAEPAGGKEGQGAVLARWNRLQRAGRVRALPSVLQ